VTVSKKLLISDLAVRGRYISRELYHVMRELIDHYGWMHLETQELVSGAGSFHDRLRQGCGATPDVVLFWEGYQLVVSAVRELIDASFCVAVFCEDLHTFGSADAFAKSVALSAAHVILVSYAPVLKKFFPAVAATKRIVWVPHAASPEFLLPFNEAAQNVVVLSGVIDHHYPLRQRLKWLADHEQPGVVQHAHPGYHCGHDHESSATVGAGYARQINAARAAFTDASKYNYLLAKFFEIPATGSLLVGDASVGTQLAELGLIEHVHYLPISEETLESTISHILDSKNHATLDEVRRRGQELVWERHKTSDRAKLIDRVCAPGE
jgi:hypothetical protein